MFDVGVNNAYKAIKSKKRRYAVLSLENDAIILGIDFFIYGLDCRQILELICSLEAPETRNSWQTITETYFLLYDINSWVEDNLHREI